MATIEQQGQKVETQYNVVVKADNLIVSPGDLYGSTSFVSKFRSVEPAVPNHFEDREETIRQLINLIDSNRWCGIFAIGGTGKTILAAYIAQYFRKNTRKQVVWLDLGQEAALEQVLESLAQSVGHSLRTIPDPRQKYGYLRSITDGMGLLIIFDDVSDNNILTSLLSSVGSGNAVVITGRDQGLRVIGKYGIDILSLESLPPDAATKVLLKLAGISPSLEVDENQWALLAESVGYLPLALEIVGGDLRFRSKRNPEEYLKTHIATGKWIESEDFSDRLKTALDESIQRLGADYKQAFSALGIFAGNGFDSKAVKAICSFDSDDKTEEFLALLRKRFLIRDNSVGTFSLHPVVRQYARDMLVKQNMDVDATTGRYLAFYFELLREYGGYEWNLSQYPRLVPYETEVINAVNLAFDLWQSANSEEEDTYLWLSVNMSFYISWYLLWRGYWNLRIQFCRRITDRLQTSGLLKDSLGQFSGIAGNLYVDRGWVHLNRNELVEAKECAIQGLALLRLSGDLIFAKELSAQIYLKSGNPQDAYKLFLDLCEDYEENTRAWFVFSFRLSDALVELNKYDEVVKYLENLLSRIPNVKLYQNEIISDVHARIAFRLAHQMLRSGNSSSAEELFEKTVELFDESGIVDETTVNAQVELARLLKLKEGNLERVQELLKNSLTQAQIIGEISLITSIGKLLDSVAPS